PGCAARWRKRRHRPTTSPASRSRRPSRWRCRCSRRPRASRRNAACGLTRWSGPVPRASLSDRQVADYAERGYVSPLTAFTPEEAAGYRGRLESMERSDGGITHDRARKMHLYLRWVDEIVHHPRILDAVEDLIGPDILLYHLTLWLKEPNSDARISWHQDSTYFGLAPPLHVTAWVALSVSDERSGCVKVVPGSHRQGQLRHGIERTPDNMFRTGQRIHVPDDTAVDSLVLQPGEFSLHHTFLHHASMPN